MGKAKYKKETSHEYAQDLLRHKGIICMSDQRIQWCKKYLNRWYRRTTKNKNREVREYFSD